jgi:hypothetical protein
MLSFEVPCQVEPFALVKFLQTHTDRQAQRESQTQYLASRTMEDTDGTFDQQRRIPLVTAMSTGAVTAILVAFVTELEDVVMKEVAISAD